MTLEDFFTLTEMKNGLTALDRIKELVSIMQEEKSSSVKNVGDAVRQWSTVASIIAITENKDCLDLFLQLDGLDYLDSWLKDAQKFGKDTGDSFVEESITALLGAVEKLLTNSQKSVNSGILSTVKNLLGYSSSKVQDKAKIMFDSWKLNNNSVQAPQDASVIESGCENQTNAITSTGADVEHPECFSHDVSHSRGSHDEGKIVDARDEMESTYSGSNYQKGVDGINIQTSDKTLDHDNQPPDPTFSDMLKLVGDNSSVQENTTIYESEVTTNSNDLALRKQATQEGQPGISNSSNNDDAKQMQQTKDCEKSDATDTSLSADLKNALESKVHIDVDNNVNANEENHFTEVSSSGNVGINVSGGKDAMGDTMSVNPCRRTSESKPTNQIHNSNADVLQKTVDNKLETCDNLDTCSLRIEHTRVTEESIGQHTNQPEDDLKISRSAVGSKDSDVIDKRSGFEHDYSTVVPEVAEQVTIEVKAQMDCRDTSYSSSERTSGRGISLSTSLDSIHGKKGKLIHDPSKDLPNEPDISSDSGDGAFINAENQITEHESQISDMAVAHVGSPASGTEPNKDERICGFDLNEVKLSDDMEHSINPPAAPLSVVYASEPAAASGFSDASLQFEGTLGWKESAETGAICSAPPRRISESENPCVASGSHDISEQRQNYLDFDLNVADALEDDKVTDLMPGKEILNSSDRPYGDSHVKVSLRKSDLLQLDLNRVSSDDDAPLHLRAEGKHLQYLSGHRSPFASSSSSMQPTVRNINLNDQPSMFNDFLDPGFIGKSSQILSSTVGLKPDDSAISIMGAKAEINQKNHVPQTSPILNGRILEYAVDTSSTRGVSVLGMGSTLPYPPSPVCGYNVPPSVPTMPFFPAMYGLGGHIPCMVDSKGSPVVPQILGSPSAIPTAYPQPPSIMSMAATPARSNEVRPLQNDFDLNMGLLVDGGNRDTGGLRHLFNSAQGRQLDDHLRANPPTSSGVGRKRKETDGGLELFPINKKHHQSPWK